jgi:hypothetical protein
MHQTKTIVLSFVLSAVFFIPQGFAETKTITLKDGSVIKGELVSFTNGTYTVKTANLGDLQLPESNVVSVASASFAPVQQAPQQAMPTQAPMGAGNFSSQVSAMQNQIMANPNSMAAIQAMAEDPEIMAMLSDPAFVQQLTAAMQGQNVEAVASDPRIQKLMANPKMQALIQQIQPGAGQ